jgi:hypothetical protein
VATGKKHGRFHHCEEGDAGLMARRHKVYQSSIISGARAHRENFFMLTGECFCGSVKYKIDGDLLAMYHCHCSRCRKLTGASFATNASVAADLFSITQGAEHLSQVGHDQHHRYHCGKCHSWVYGDSGDYAGVIFIPCGSLNETPLKKVDHHVCVASKAGWIDINDDLPQYPGIQPREGLLEGAAS